MPAHAFCSPQKSCRCTMGRSPGFEGTACAVDRFTFPSDALSGCLAAADLQVGLTEATVPRYSGGTAPDSHRTSPLCPSWAPKAGSVLFRHGAPSGSLKPTPRLGGISFTRLSALTS